MLELASSISKTVGTMRKLPRWILDGVVIGIVNGQDFVDEKYEFMKNLGLPMAGIWMQDWAG